MTFRLYFKEAGGWRACFSLGIKQIKISNVPSSKVLSNYRVQWARRGKAKRDIRGPPHGGTGGLIYAQIDSTSIAMR